VRRASSCRWTGGPGCGRGRGGHGTKKKQESPQGQDKPFPPKATTARQSIVCQVPGWYVTQVPSTTPTGCVAPGSVGYPWSLASDHDGPSPGVLQVVTMLFLPSPGGGPTSEIETGAGVRTLATEESRHVRPLSRI
jgi:hypothetical protein